MTLTHGCLLCSKVQQMCCAEVRYNFRWSGQSIVNISVEVLLGMYSILCTLKVHKREKFFGSDFQLFTILQLVKLKY